jgi:hypothetical protein
MMKINMILSCMLLWLVSACTSQEVVDITVSPEVTNAGYIGNGAEWDPYDEAEAWGALLDKDWETLCKRSFMKPVYTLHDKQPYAIMIRNRQYDKTRNLVPFPDLKYCTRGDNVMYGEYYRCLGYELDQKWVDMSVDFLITGE